MAASPATIDAALAGNAGRLSTLPLARTGFVVLVLWALVETIRFAGNVAAQSPDSWLAIATASVMGVATLLSSIAGFAFSAIAGSALAYLGVEPIEAVHTMTLCSIAIQAYCVCRIRESIRWSVLWPMLAAGALTVPLGVWLLVRIDAAVYAAGLGVFLVLFYTPLTFYTDNFFYRRRQAKLAGQRKQ